MIATDKQLARLRELASDFGLPEEAAKYVEDRITAGLTQVDALKLIQALGGRIQKLQEART